MLVSSHWPVSSLSGALVEGDRVALMLPAHPDLCDAFFALMRRSAVVESESGESGT